MRRGEAVLMLVVTLGAHTSCSSLEELELDVCGNRVIDPSRGERCDSSDDEPGAHCARPGEPNECRYVCSLDPQGNPYRCPMGWGCDRNGLCQPAASTFTAPIRLSLPSGMWAAAFDVDGDGYDDVATQYAEGSGVAYFEDGAVADDYVLPLAGFGKASAADLDGDGRVELIVPTIDGLTMLAGDTLRQPAPLSFAPIPLPKVANKLIDVDLLPDVVTLSNRVWWFIGHEPIVLADDDSTFVIASVKNTTVFDFDVAQLTSLPPVGAFDTERSSVPPGALGLAVQQIVLAHFGQSNLELLRPVYFESVDNLPAISLRCTGDGAPCLNPQQIALVPAATVGFTVVATHANPRLDGDDSAIVCGAGQVALGDEHLDLVLETSNGPYVAYGLGNGHFHGVACELDEVALGSIVADDSARPWSPLANCTNPLLAAGDIDADGLLDVVSLNKIHLSGWAVDLWGAGLCDNVSPTVREQSGWVDARLLDIDADGDTDVVASNRSTGIDVWRWSSGTPTLTRIGTGELKGSLAVGDFDGNGIADVAFTELLGAGAKDRVAIIFGEQYANPGEPITVAELREVRAYASSRVSQVISDYPDGIDDLLVTTSKDDPHAAILYGRADRELNASWFAQYGLLDAEHYAPVNAVVVSQGYDLNEEPVEQRLLALGFKLPELGPTAPLEIGLSQARVTDDGDFVLYNEGAQSTPLFESITSDEHVLDLLGARMVRLRNGLDADRAIVLRPVVYAGPRYTTLAQVTRTDSGTGFEPIDSFASFEGMSLAGGYGLIGTLGSWSASLSADPQGCNLDGSGRDALVMMLLEEVACPDSTPDTEPRLRVLLAEALATQLGDSAATLAQSLAVTLPPGETLLSFTCGNIDLDVADEIVFVTVTTPVPSCAELGPDWHAGGANIYRVDLTDGALTTPIAIGSITPAVAPSLESHPESSPISSILLGDFDGNGVNDVLVGVDLSSVLLLGEVAPP